MSAEESKGVDPDLPELTENEDNETRMTYGAGTTTWYLIAVWVTAIVGFVIYAAKLLVPSLGSWGAP